MMNPDLIWQAERDADCWITGLKRDTEHATKLLAQWTPEDIAAFPAFMAAFLPHAVQAYDAQRPSAQGGGSRA